MFDEFDDTDVHLKDEESSSDEEAPKSMGFGKVRGQDIEIVAFMFKILVSIKHG